MLLVCLYSEVKLGPWLVLTSAFHKRSVIPQRVCSNLRSCWAASCVYNGSLFSAGLYAPCERGGEGVGIVGLQGPWLGCAVSAMCHEERKEGDGRREKPQVEAILQKVVICWLVSQQPSSFQCSLVSSVLFFLLLLIWFFIFKDHSFVTSFFFSAEDSHSLPDLFLGAKQQVALIYGDFITRRECF